MYILQSQVFEHFIEVVFWKREGELELTSI